ncbi:FAD-dependent oxidoreductase [Rhodopila sp.]|uniref:FAD-dependent oxidoreductase n=1 Tax=Rhodopila sp. TaxID=2480087 RepID=UPI003D10C04E
MRQIATRVLIAGGGPVGLTVAMDLAWRGIAVVVLESRAPGEPPSVKCNHVSARTMEIFRRLGVVRAVREAGLPADYPNDIAFRTTTTGTELSRIPIPCRADRYSATGGPDTWWPTPEPPHRINQIFLEPVLFAHAGSMPGVRILNRMQLTGFQQHDAGVTATVADLDGGEDLTISADYLIGADGAHSLVRRRIGASLTGDAMLEQRQSTYIRAPELLRATPTRPAWANTSLNPRRSANMFAIDGRETWLVHNYMRPGETFDNVDREWCIRTILGVGPSFPFEIIAKEDWTARRMIADRFRDRRVFLCGDAAHIWVPNAGYGMNAGIADAMNLSWMLAGVLNGWASPAILDCYEIERMPITEQVSRYAMATSAALARQRGVVPDNIEQLGSDGDAARARLGQDAYDINVGQFCCGGLNFGSFVEQSPIIAGDGAHAPGYTIYDFTPSTVPGCRTPHIWLQEGTSLYDVMGADFTLLRFDRSVDVGDVTAAAQSRGVPLKVVDVSTREPVYAEKLVLSRPDQHVAWRGNAAPTDPAGLIDQIRGARRLAG